MKSIHSREKFSRKNKHPVLVLDSSYMPIDVYSWKKAVCTWYAGKAEIISSYKDVYLHSGINRITLGQIVIQMPCIIRLLIKSNKYIALSDTLALNKKNILDRDEHRCAYCGCPLTLNTMTIDHVYPISKGGLTDWANLRASCAKCNAIKKDKTLEELGWIPRIKVCIPTLSKKVPKNIVSKIGGRIANESWRPYIYWDVKSKIEDK